MSAYYSGEVSTFLNTELERVLGTLLTAQDIVTPEQKRAWSTQLQILRTALEESCRRSPAALQWGLLIEYSLFRVERRLDTVVLTGAAICVIEFKVGATSVDASSRRQAQDYALDLHDFHGPSRAAPIFSAVCATESKGLAPSTPVLQDNVANVDAVSPDTLAEFLLSASQCAGAEPQVILASWEGGAYSPVPTIIEAASMLYLTHSVDEIRQALSSHVNLNETIDRIAEIRLWAKSKQRHVVCFVTGVPGSGKTLVGLNLVHDPRFDPEGTGDSAFLSGNSPLVKVLREALARDAHKAKGSSLGVERRRVSSRIQHLMNYLKQYLDQEPGHAPHDHIVVFDEAQRAWDEDYGKRRFGRTASEPYLFLDILARHSDWALIVALVGGGQEINTGEHGLSEWGNAIQRFNEESSRPTRWAVFGPEDVVEGRALYGGSALWSQSPPKTVELMMRDGLHLPITIRSHRNEVANEWVAALLDGRQLEARRLAAEVKTFPVYVTRSLEATRSWLRKTTRGHRRFGLLATSGARRLRGYGLGVSLNAADLDAIVHWFLAEPEDVRSSFALEVTANEFACQGLELDRVGVCWDNDMAWDAKTSTWLLQSFKGYAWKKIKDEAKRRYIANSYRVLLTRAREAVVIWVPPGDPGDPTRPIAPMDATYRLLLSCGVRRLEDVEVQSMLA